MAKKEWGKIEDDDMEFSDPEFSSEPDADDPDFDQTTIKQCIVSILIKFLYPFSFIFLLCFYITIIFINA